MSDVSSSSTSASISETGSTANTALSSATQDSLAHSEPGHSANTHLPADSTNCNSVVAQKSSGPRKNSAERSITHTRMEDGDVGKEYEYGEILGEGSFGKVYRASHRLTGHTVAIKEIVKEKAGSSGLRQLEKEVSIFKKVDHKNIIKLKEVIESPKKMYLIMELCEGGDLAQLLQRRTHLTEADTKVVMSDLAAAIKYLHQQGILHRDLKLENILLAQDPDTDHSIQIKVTDFGLSTQQINNSYENMQEQFCGTLSYMAPEMNSTYSYPVDVWAMGIIMYYLLTRYPKDNVLNEFISKNGPKFEEPQWVHVSDQAKDLLTEMLQINPAYRLSSGEVLNHEWFTGKKREHKNVLEMMKEYVKEQKEEASNSIHSDDQVEGAINGSDKLKDGIVPSTSAVESKSTPTKKELRKSPGNKMTSTDTHYKPPVSSSVLRQGQKQKPISSGNLQTTMKKVTTAKVSTDHSGKVSPAAARIPSTPKPQSPTGSAPTMPRASSKLTAPKTKRK